MGKFQIVLGTVFTLTLIGVGGVYIYKTVQGVRQRDKALELWEARGTKFDRLIRGNSTTIANAEATGRIAVT